MISRTLTNFGWFQIFHFFRIFFKVLLFFSFYLKENVSSYIYWLIPQISTIIRARPVQSHNLEHHMGIKCGSQNPSTWIIICNSQGMHCQESGIQSKAETERRHSDMGFRCPKHYSSQFLSYSPLSEMFLIWEPIIFISYGVLIIIY